MKSKSSRPGSNKINSNDKAQFLAKLDTISGFADEISKFQKLLASNEKINICIDADSVYVQDLQNGISFNWEISDPRTAIACLAVAGEYETRETRLISSIVKYTSQVIDVGANVGYYSIRIPYFTKHVVKVYSFEPIAKSFRELTRNIVLNQLQDVVEAFNCAASNTNGELVMYVPKLFGTSATSSVELHPEDENQEVRVETVRIDDFIKNGKISGCDFLKIDVEGAEKFVVEGAIELLSRDKPVVLAEILRKWSRAHGYEPQELLDILFGLGYQCYSIGTTLNQIVEIGEEVVETNFLFFNKSNIQHFLIASEIGLEL